MNMHVNHLGWVSAFKSAAEAVNGQLKKSPIDQGFWTGLLNIGVCLLFILASTASHASEWDKLRIDGFANLNAAQKLNREELSDNTAINSPEKFDQDVNFIVLSTLGIQLSASLTEKSRLVSQLVGKGDEEHFDIAADWVYYQHEMSPQWSFKFGRMRTPFFLLSEYLDVTYAVPWADMPDEVYDILEPFANYEAADLTYRYELSESTITLQTQYGRLIGDTWDIQETVSFNAQWSDEYWTLRAGIARGSAVILEDNALLSNPAVINANIYEKHHVIENKGYEAMFYSLATHFDDGQWLGIAEWTRLTVEGITVDQDAYYVTLGRRWGNWTPHLTYGDAKSQDDKIRRRNNIARRIDVDLYRWAIGVRWDFESGTALKAQYEEFINQKPSDDERVRTVIVGINAVF